MKTLTLIVLLFTSQFANAKVSPSELDCVAQSTYHEARSLGKLDWLKVANVAYNRKLNFKKHKFHARSSHLCDIVRSQEFSSGTLLNSPIKEKKVYAEIRSTLLALNWYTTTNALYFSTVNNQMRYR